MQDHLPMGLNNKIIGLMKDEMGGKVMTEFVALRPKLYAYRKLDDKKCEGIKKCVMKEDKRCKANQNVSGEENAWL